MQVNDLLKESDHVLVDMLLWTLWYVRIMFSHLRGMIIVWVKPGWQGVITLYNATMAGCDLGHHSVKPGKI